MTWIYIYTHVLLHIVIYNWTSVSKISFLRFPRTGKPEVQHGWLWSFSAWLQGTWYFWCHHLCGWLWHGNELKGCASTLQWCLCPKKRWGGGESHWKMVNFVGIKMVLRKWIVLDDFEDFDDFLKIAFRKKWCGKKKRSVYPAFRNP